MTILTSETSADSAAGQFLRRFWQPIALAASVSEATPILPVRVLSEGLVLFRSTSGQLGLVQERCPHNGYPLVEGWVDENSLICPRHAWHFGCGGDCWVVAYQDKTYPVQWANARSYPVQEYAGLYWSYLGPDEAPPLPRLDRVEQAQHGLRLTVSAVIAAGWSALACAALERGAEILLPTHTALDDVELRLPVDDEHTWCVRLQPVDELPVGTVEIVHANSASPSAPAVARSLEQIQHAWLTYSA